MSLRKLEAPANPEDCLRNPLNNSSSKMQYSFAKSRRFNHSLSNTVPYYNLPTELDKRTTNFGYGNKTTFEDRRVLPPPNAYRPQSDFDDRKHGASFGYSREQVRNSSMFMKSEVPGPGTYNPKETRHETSFTLKSRVRDSSLDEKIKVPGPGHYIHLQLINKLGRYPASKYENSRCPVIAKSVYRMKTEETPAPNSYFPIVLNSRGEKSMRQTQASKFGQSRRQGIFEPSDIPGPGQYQQFSEFLK